MARSFEESSPIVGRAALSHAEADDTKRSGAGFFIGIFLPIVLIMTLIVWVFYAYRNPHTKSGQLLIQVSIFSLPLCYL